MVDIHVIFLGRGIVLKTTCAGWRQTVVAFSQDG